MATVETKLRSANGDNLGELLDRQPPRSIEAERAVIGSLLLLPEACDEVALLIRPDDFYDGAHRIIFNHMLALHDGGQQIDPTLLSQRLKDTGQYESVGGAAFLLELSQEVATAAHAEYYARIVRDKAVLRALIHASTDIIHESYETGVDAREMLSRAEERVFRILDTKGDTKVRPVREILHESLARIDARMQHEHAYGGLETGFIDYDDLTGGLHDSELVILAARPSMGKTALALNIAEHIAIDERGPAKPVLIVSLEMSALELGDRLLCSRARVNSHRLRNGQVGADESRRLIQTATDVSRAPLYIDDSPSRNMTEIAATARRLKRQEGLSLIVIDYLQLIEPDNPRDPRQEQVARISRRLKGLARELSVPVLCLAQLNRQVEATRDSKPQLSHLRESGAIEQDADVVVFVHRDEFYQSNEEDRERVKGQADLLIRKQRNGPTGDIKLTWLHEFTRFENWQQPEYDEFADFGPDTF
ncbi:MAG TPA: replicative DNA helicase [Lacipirellulaceae bacterium]|nr:replicative DNA helicase [Lacipirellulaceae bacterium]